MATIYTHRSENIAKTWALMGLFSALVIGLGWVMGQYMRDPMFFTLAIVVSLGMNVASFWFSDRIALSSVGARPVTKAEYPDLYRIVENLSITAGLPMPKIYVVNDPTPNAFATGRDPEHAVVAVHTGILPLLDKAELEGVLAHELSHVGNRDTLVMTAAVVLAGTISMIADLFFRMSLWGGGRNSDENRNAGLFALLAIVGAVLAPFAATLLQFAVSRRREFLADASGALLTRYPEGLARALEKISAVGMTSPTATTATAHLYIANPFRGSRATSWFSNLMSTHPPIAERVAALRGMNMG